MFNVASFLLFTLVSMQRLPENPEMELLKKTTNEDLSEIVDMIDNSFYYDDLK